MRVLSVRNVCEALPRGIELLLSEGVKSSSRAGDVLVAPWPVSTVYSRPRERVLFSPIRDANPAFHLAEAFWMLAGRNDAAFLNLFIKDFGERFAELDGTIHGAYGHRWRKAFGADQLVLIIRRLIENPEDRQCVLQMWDCSPIERQEGFVSDDLLFYKDGWRDRPCNTHCYFRVRDGMLDMGVCCRSNDIIMGAYGANAVHFSILQEYMAAMIDAGVGTYTQFSFNYHMYEKDLETLRKRGMLGHNSVVDDRYMEGMAEPEPLIDDDGFDKDVISLIEAIEAHPKIADLPAFRNSFIKHTAYPLLKAYLSRNIALANRIEALDWRMALVEWLKRRENKT